MKTTHVLGALMDKEGSRQGQMGRVGRLKETLLVCLFVQTGLFGVAWPVAVFCCLLLVFL